MMAWFSPLEIAAAAKGDLPGTVRGLNRVIERDGWRLDSERCRKADGKGGGFEYHVSLLPRAVQVRLGAAHAALHSVAPPSVGSADISPARGEIEEVGVWDRFERLPQKHKDEAMARLKALALVLEYRDQGASGTSSVRLAARDCGVSAASLYNWQHAVKGVDRSDWLAVLAPSYAGGAKRKDCEGAAYAMLKADVLRDSKCSFSAAYERVQRVAKKNGWPLPPERTMRRWFDKDVPEAVRVLAREGLDAATRLFPAQQRSVAHMHAMLAVNMDGHKIDVFAKAPDGRIIRYFLIGIQDVFSRKVLSWRLAEAETKEAVRLVIGDMVEAYGIPKRFTFDNGRAFASKWITGGAANRYRFKVRDEEPEGLLLSLGIKADDIHWTKPYAGQSKPIERGWRDLAETISKHPFCAGAYTGNRPDAKPESYGSRGIPLEDLRGHVAREIGYHNAREGRETEIAAGRSFDAVFTQSLAAPGTIVADATDAQKALWLLAAERIKTRKGNGEIHFMGNRYWHPVLTGHANASVAVRFDPDALQEPLRVYNDRNQLLCIAECIAATGFDDQDAARAHARNRSAAVKTFKAMKALHVTLSPSELTAIYAEGEAAPQVAKQKAKVTRIAGGPSPAAAQPVWDSEDEQAFSRGFRMIAGGKR